MAYYDSIAKDWHATTGNSGGPFKELVLNDILLGKLAGIDRGAILELGAGNGYFMPLVLRRFPGQVPSGITITDHSLRQLAYARRHFKVPEARYQYLDVGQPFPFADCQFDLVIASMIFNEVSGRSVKNALQECHRVLSHQGQLLIAVTHPDFVDSLRRRGLLKRTRTGAQTMPGSGSLRLPVVPRSVARYRQSLHEAGFVYEEEEGFSTPEVLQLKAGLRHTWKIPVALIFRCTKLN